MKKRLAILLVGCLVFSFAACSFSGNNGQPSQTQKATQEQESNPIQAITSPESSEAEKGTSAVQEQTEEVPSGDSAA